MRRALLLVVVVVAVLSPSAWAEDSRTYDRDLETVWEHAVKAVRDVDFVLVESDRAEHRFTMRTKSKLSAKRGIELEVGLVGRDQLTVVRVEVLDERKAARAAKHVRAYLEALDRRLH